MFIQGTTVDFNMNFINKNGQPLAITGATIVFKFRRNEIGETISKACNVSEDIPGRCSVLLTPEDLKEDGTYYYSTTITYPDTTVSKSELLSFFVEENL